MFLICKNALNVGGFILVRLGHPVRAHLEIPRSIPDQSQNFSSLCNCTWRDVVLCDRKTKSSA
jgi:hypothetical protein